MIASENITSPAVRKLLQSDMGHRYTSPDRYYRGTRFSDEAKAMTEELARDLFGAEYANVGLISGHITDVMTVSAYAKHGDTIITTEPTNGGYPGLSREGFPYVLGLRVEYWTYNSSEMNLDIERCKALVESAKPRMVFFGSSFFPFPHPVRELAEVAHDKGAIVVYDGSHVLGLIAGKEFQDPLREGADILVGSTHKSFPGPQGGILLTNKEHGATMDQLNAHHAIVDNPHLHRMLALGQALYEMRRFGRQYAVQIVKNSKALAESLAQRAVPVVAKERGYTKSHQVILDFGSPERAVAAADKLERANIIVDTGVRIGTAEETRRGMKEREMRKIGDLIAAILRDEVGTDVARKEVVKLRARFRAVRYC
jgi:glycine hydroxymethyltransferase